MAQISLTIWSWQVFSRTATRSSNASCQDRDGVDRGDGASRGYLAPRVATALPSHEAWVPLTDGTHASGREGGPPT